MLAKVLSSAIVGLDAELVDVEVDIIQGYPQFHPGRSARCGRSRKS